MKILSLFDGMACGALAMQAAGIEIDKYIAYEIDKYAIQTAQHNFPFIEERGDVFKADFTEYTGFDYLIGGSPCTYWSIAQTKNRETVASGMGWELFSQYVRALHEAKPRFFLYENNKSMSAAIRASITETFGFEPILINSALVSAQNRQRLYWCGIRQADGTYKKADIQQPADRGILLKDILETNAVYMARKGIYIYNEMSGRNYRKTPTHNGAEPVQPLTEKEMDYMIRDHQDQRWSFCNKPGQEDKSKCLVANVHKGVPYNILAEPVNVMKYELQSVENKDAGVVGILDMAGQEQIKRVYGTNGKCATLTTCQGGHREPKVFERIADPVCVAQRGRYDESGKVYQHYEAQPTGKTNNLTTVSKDNLIAELICVNSKSGRAGVEGLQPSLQDRVYDTAGKMPAVTSSFNPKITEPVNITKDGKAGTLRATYYKDGVRNLIANSIDKKTCVAMRVNEATKAAPIYEVKDGFITVKGNKYPIKLVDGFYIIRKLTVRECMRLQTVPEWYEWPVSKSQAYKMLGNGWTVEVIAHLLRGLK